MSQENDGQSFNGFGGFGAFSQPPQNDAKTDAPQSTFAFSNPWGASDSKPEENTNSWCNFGGFGNAEDQKNEAEPDNNNTTAAWRTADNEPDKVEPNNTNGWAFGGFAAFGGSTKEQNHDQQQDLNQDQQEDREGKDNKQESDSDFDDFQEPEIGEDDEKVQEGTDKHKSIENQDVSKDSIENDSNNMANLDDQAMKNGDKEMNGEEDEQDSPHNNDCSSDDKDKNIEDDSFEDFNDGEEPTKEELSDKDNEISKEEPIHEETPEHDGGKVEEDELPQSETQVEDKAEDEKENIQQNNSSSDSIDNKIIDPETPIPEEHENTGANAEPAETTDLSQSPSHVQPDVKSLSDSASNADSSPKSPEPNPSSPVGDLSDDPASTPSNPPSSTETPLEQPSPPNNFQIASSAIINSESEEQVTNCQNEKEETKSYQIEAAQVDDDDVAVDIEKSERIIGRTEQHEVELVQSDAHVESGSRDYGEQEDEGDGLQHQHTDEQEQDQVDDCHVESDEKHENVADGVEEEGKQGEEDAKNQVIGNDEDERQVDDEKQQEIKIDEDVGDVSQDKEDLDDEDKEEEDEGKAREDEDKNENNDCKANENSVEEDENKIDSKEDEAKSEKDDDRIEDKERNVKKNSNNESDGSESDFGEFEDSTPPPIINEEKEENKVEETKSDNNEGDQLAKDDNSDSSFDDFEDPVEPENSHQESNSPEKTSEPKESPVKDTEENSSNSSFGDFEDSTPPPVENKATVGPISQSLTQEAAPQESNSTQPPANDSDSDFEEFEEPASQPPAACTSSPESAAKPTQAPSFSFTLDLSAYKATLPSISPEVTSCTDSLATAIFRSLSKHPATVAHLSSHAPLPLFETKAKGAVSVMPSSALPYTPAKFSIDSTYTEPSYGMINVTGRGKTTKVVLKKDKSRIDDQILDLDFDGTEMQNTDAPQVKHLTDSLSKNFKGCDWEQFSVYNRLASFMKLEHSYNNTKKKSTMLDHESIVHKADDEDREEEQADSDHSQEFDSPSKTEESKAQALSTKPPQNQSDEPAPFYEGWDTTNFKASPDLPKPSASSTANRPSSLVTETFKEFGLNQVAEEQQDSALDSPEGKTWLERAESRKGDNSLAKEVLERIPDYAFLIDKNICFPADFFE